MPVIFSILQDVQNLVRLCLLGFVCSLFVLFARIAFYFGISTVYCLFFQKISAVGDGGTLKTK